MELFIDVESYINYFLVQITNREGRSKAFEIFEDDDSMFDSAALYQRITAPGVTAVTFNGNIYDVPMITMALAGFTTKALKRWSDTIIKANLKPWQTYREAGVREIEGLNHIDLIETAPGVAVSLKGYGGRLHSRRLQDLPLPPEAVITEEQRPLMRRYCKNDTLITRDLFLSLSKQLQLRESMSEEYGRDLRSKSDAQIAEAVLSAEYTRITGEEPKRGELSYDSFYYEPPKYLRFLSDDLKEKFEVIKSAEMEVSETGHVKLPKQIANMKITIGDTTYKLGIGGIHSQESEVAHVSDDEYQILDRDVASYYPNLMLNMGMSPGAFGEHFQTVYRDILERRMEAKRSGNKVVADSLKITLNGTFGKLANKYSKLYAPMMMVKTTLTGQLSLLMLIEMCEKLGIPVVSANTDGIVLKVHNTKHATLDKILARWEQVTNLETEETLYAALYSKDVNNYIAVKPDGTTKAKGLYAAPSLMKNPVNIICNEAAARFCAGERDYASYIRECADLTKFITIRRVSGGAVKDGELVGKNIRWYYSTEVEGCITSAKDDSNVPRTEGAQLVMDMPGEFPSDVDYEWYINETRDILLAVGAIERPKVAKIPRKNSNAWKALYEAGEIQLDHKGKKWEWVKPEEHLLGDVA